jgi:hypothetical protein
MSRAAGTDPPATESKPAVLLELDVPLGGDWSSTDLDGHGPYVVGKIQN